MPGPDGLVRVYRSAEVKGTSPFGEVNNVQKWGTVFAVSLLFLFPQKYTRCTAWRCNSSDGNECSLRGAL